MYGTVEILRNKTNKLLHINIDETLPKTNQLVYVKCKRCGEVFTRIFYIAPRLHRCPIYKIASGIKVKWCNNCTRFLPYNKFGHDKSPRATIGLSAYCLECIARNARNARTDFDKWIHKYIITKQSACNIQHILCTINEEFLRDLWKKQDGKCFYSDVKLEFNNTGLAGASLDRINPAKGYTRNNVVWCSRAINRMKQDNSYDDVSEFLMKATFNKFRG